MEIQTPTVPGYSDAEAGYDQAQLQRILGASLFAINTTVLGAIAMVTKDPAFNRVVDGGFSAEDVIPIMAIALPAVMAAIGGVREKIYRNSLDAKAR